MLALNNFNETVQAKMMAKALQAMFPPLNLNTMTPERVKRIVSFTFVKHKRMVYFRHYHIKISQGGINPAFSKLLNAKRVDMSKFKTMGEYL